MIDAILVGCTHVIELLVSLTESGSEMSISWINPEFSNDHECKSYWVKLYDPFYIRAMGG